MPPTGTKRPSATRVPDPLEELRVLVADPGVLLRRRAGEDQVGVLGHQRQHVGEGAGALARRLAHRPQPGRVDVRVPDGGDPVRARVRRLPQHLGEHGPSRRGRAGHVARLDHVDHGVQGPQHERAARRAERQLVHQAVSGCRRPGSTPRRRVSSSASHAPSNRYCGSVPAVARSPSGVGWNVVGPRSGIGRGLDVDVDRPVPGQREVPVTRVQALHDRAVRGVRRRLGREARLGPAEPEVDHDLGPQTLLRRPVGRHVSGQPEPGRAPRVDPTPDPANTARTSRRTRCRSRPAPPAHPTTPRSTAAAAGRPPVAAARSRTGPPAVRPVPRRRAPGPLADLVGQGSRLSGRPLPGGQDQGTTPARR